jgi:hypothetical protein
MKRLLVLTILLCASTVHAQDTARRSSEFLLGHGVAVGGLTNSYSYVMDASYLPSSSANGGLMYSFRLGFKDTYEEYILAVPSQSSSWDTLIPPGKPFENTTSPEMFGTIGIAYSLAGGLGFGMSGGISGVRKTTYEDRIFTYKKDERILWRGIIGADLHYRGDGVMYKLGYDNRLGTSASLLIGYPRISDQRRVDTLKPSRSALTLSLGGGVQRGGFLEAAFGAGSTQAAFSFGYLHPSQAFAYSLALTQRSDDAMINTGHFFSLIGTSWVYRDQRSARLLTANVGYILQRIGRLQVSASAGAGVKGLFHWSSHDRYVTRLFPIANAEIAVGLDIFGFKRSE